MRKFDLQITEKHIFALDSRQLQLSTCIISRKGDRQAGSRFVLLSAILSASST